VGFYRWQDADNQPLLTKWTEWRAIVGNGIFSDCRLMLGCFLTTVRTIESAKYRNWSFRNDYRTKAKHDAPECIVFAGQLRLNCG